MTSTDVVSMSNGGSVSVIVVDSPSPVLAAMDDCAAVHCALPRCEHVTEFRRRPTDAVRSVYDATLVVIRSVALRTVTRPTKTATTTHAPVVAVARTVEAQPHSQPVSPAQACVPHCGCA